MVKVAIVSHPSPRIIGSTALPLQPIFLKRRSIITASRGRYPESSRIPNPRKKVPTIGRTIATAYERAMEIIPYGPTRKSRRNAEGTNRSRIAATDGMTQPSKNDFCRRSTRVPAPNTPTKP